MRCLLFVIAISLTPTLLYAQEKQLYFKGKIYTMDEANPWAEAMIVQGEKILATGNEHELRKLGPFTSETDLDKQFLMPAFYDNHTHPVDSGAEYLECKVYDAQTPQELFQILVDYNQKLSKNDKWLIGVGWSVFQFDNKEHLHKKFLDDLPIDRPIALMSSDGHSYWLNSKALNIVGVNDQTPNPVGGHLGRDSDGKLNGIFYENAILMVQKVIPRRTAEQLELGLLAALEEMKSLGITSFKDAYVTEEQLMTYVNLERKNLLTAQAYLSLALLPEYKLEDFQKLISWREKYSSKKIKINTIKVFLDGVMEDQTAALSENYLNSDQAGILYWKQNDLNFLVGLAERTGFQVHFHAIGDAAITQALDAIEYSRRLNGHSDSRHEIAHLQLIHPKDLKRFYELNVSSVFSPIWAINDNAISEYVEPFIGPERARWIYPIGSVVKAGGRMAFGSDWSVTSMNPFEAIQVALTRTPIGARECSDWLVEERISLETALRGYTTGGAYANFSEKISGSLMPGKNADFIVLDKNPFEVKPMEISTIKVRQTYHLGKLL